jgi:cell division protein YceG involved in septum cleavage
MKKFLLILFLLVGTVLIFKTLFEAPRKSGPKVLYRVPQSATQSAITGDLKYYDFIKDETAFKFALWIEGGIQGKDIQRGMVYEISQTMSAWQIANILLNKDYRGEPYSCDHGCPEGNFNPELLPGGDLAPTISQKYEWLKTYEDCVKSIGHDGGQLSSEQYAQKTGIRKCVSPDGREFTQGKEGWTTAVGG